MSPTKSWDQAGSPTRKASAFTKLPGDGRASLRSAIPVRTPLSGFQRYARVSCWSRSFASPFTPGKGAQRYSTAPPTPRTPGFCPSAIRESTVDCDGPKA